MWETPLNQVGWLIACDLRRQGAKGVGRKPKKADMAAALDRLGTLLDG